MSSTVYSVVLGTPSSGEVSVRCRAGGFWRSNIPWPGLALVALPNGETWDLSTFANGTRENPIPLDEDAVVRFTYSGWVPPAYYQGMSFPIVLTVVREPKP